MPSFKSKHACREDLQAPDLESPSVMYLGSGLLLSSHEIEHQSADRKRPKLIGPLMIKGEQWQTG